MKFILKILAKLDIYLFKINIVDYMFMNMFMVYMFINMFKGFFVWKIMELSNEYKKILTICDYISKAFRKGALY